MTTEIIVTEKHLAVFDVKEAVLSEFKEAESLKCKDASSRKMLGKFRADAKSLRAKIEQARLDKNREVLALNNGAATAIKDRLTASIDAYDTEIKPYDQVAKDKKDAKDKAEADRVANINEKIDDLKKICARPLEYNQTSDNIRLAISLIEEFEINDDLQEFKSQAEMIKIGGISAAKQALMSRQDWEAQQAENKRIQDEKDAENERVRLENEAKAKELAEAQAKIEAEQEKARQEAAMVAKEAADKQAKADAEAKAKREAEEAKLAKEREEFERQKAEAEKAAQAKIDVENDRIADENRKIQAEKDRMEAEATERAKEAKKREQISLWSDWAAMLEHDWREEACRENEKVNQIRYDLKKAEEAARIEQLAAKEKRAALVGYDRKALAIIALDIDSFISEIDFPSTKTDDAGDIALTFVAEMKMVINKFEKSLTELA